MEYDEFIPERLKPIFDYWIDQGMYYFDITLLETSLFFNIATAIQLKNIRIERSTNHGTIEIIPNFMSILLMPSGAGKGMSVKLTREPFSDMFDTFVDRANSFIMNPNNRDEKNELNPQYIKINHPYTPAGSTTQGLQKISQTISDMGFGAVSIYDDELGDNITGLGKIFTKIKTAFDDGIAYGDVNVSSGGENYFTVEDICYNVLLMGSPGIFEQQPKLKEQLLSHFISGIARRTFIYHNATYKKSENRNSNYETLSETDIKIAKNYFKELRSFINNMENIKMPQKVYQELIDYDISKEILRENSDSVLADDTGSPKKIERLAGLIAVLDLSEVITSEHLKYAISYTEKVDSTAEAAHRIKPTYEQIYDILDQRGFISRTELLKNIKGLTLKNLDDEIILTTEFASQLGNSIVTKKYSGIIKYKLERLTKTKLDKIILSINKNPNATEPKGFKRIFGNFFNIHSIVCSNLRYSAGTFMNEYITDKNYLSEQNIIIIDVDDGITIEDTKALFKNVVYMIATTKSHRKPKGKDNLSQDRFRLILPTVSKFHLTPEIYSKMYKNLLDALGMSEADTKCSNASRWYYGYPNGEYWYNGKDEDIELLDIRPFIPDTSEYNSGSNNVENYISTNKGDDGDDVDTRLAAAYKWFLTRTSQGNRNEMLFRFGMMIKEHYSTQDPETHIRKFNQMIESLNETELGKIIRSVSRR